MAQLQEDKISVGVVTGKALSTVLVVMIGAAVMMTIRSSWAEKVQRKVLLVQLWRRYKSLCMTLLYDTNNITTHILSCLHKQVDAMHAEISL